MDAHAVQPRMESEQQAIARTQTKKKYGFSVEAIGISELFRGALGLIGGGFACACGPRPGYVTRVPKCLISPCFFLEKIFGTSFPAGIPLSASSD